MSVGDSKKAGFILHEGGGFQIPVWFGPFMPTPELRLVGCFSDDALREIEAAGDKEAIFLRLLQVNSAWNRLASSRVEGSPKPLFSVWFKRLLEEYPDVPELNGWEARVRLEPELFRL